MRSEVQSFDSLVAAIARAHAALAAQASAAVNISLTLRNWLIGCHIQEYEQAGADRADYGTQLLDKVSARLAQAGMAGVAARSLRQYRQFYLAYPQIWQTPSAESLRTSNRCACSTLAPPCCNGSMRRSARYMHKPPALRPRHGHWA